MDYATIKAQKLAGCKPELAAFDKAIFSQSVVVGQAACKLATIVGKHEAQHEGPFPTECDHAAVEAVQAQADFNRQMDRLARLVKWRELAAQGL